MRTGGAGALDLQPLEHLLAAHRACVPTPPLPRLRVSGREQVGDGTRSDRLTGESFHPGGRSRRVLLSRLRERVSAIRLRKAGEGLLLSLLQHTADAVGALAPAPLASARQDAVSGTSDQDSIRAGT